MDVSDLEPMIAFHCYCGKRLYSMSTRVGAWENDLECERCGQKYRCDDSIIARIVPPSASEWASTVGRLFL
jgi:hypothetical protein